MDNECSGHKRDLTIGDFTDLVKLLEQSVFHSHLKTGRLVSTLHVNLPTLGHRNYLHCMRREVESDIGAAAENEMTGAIEVLAKELKYLIEHGTEFGEPVFGNDVETGEQNCIGKSMNIIDRTRLTLPLLITSDSEVGHTYIDCTKDYSPS